MRAVIEHIVIDRQCRNIEERLPNLEDLNFGFGARSPAVEIRGERKCLARIGQCAMVELSVGRQRQRRESHKARGDHVGRQCPLQMPAQLGLVNTRRDHIVGSEEPVLRRAAHNHCRVVNRGMLAERVGNLSRFDAEATQLDLIVVPAEIFELAVIAPAGAIAAAVKSLARAVRIGDKSLIRKLVAAKIALSHTLPADEQFAWHTARDRFKVAVEQVKTKIRNWLADHT